MVLTKVVATRSGWNNSFYFSFQKLHVGCVFELADQNPRQAPNFPKKRIQSVKTTF